MADPARVEVWARALIRVHLDGSWDFGFDRARARAGQCDWTRRRITVSRPLVALLDDDEAHQILLHEVAHAKAGHAAGHGPAWRRIARELGYVGGRTHDGAASRELAPWVGVCPAGHEHARFRRPGKPASCGRCSRRFSRDHLIVWRPRG